ncbi:hypothetical protein UlMin_036107 [Ulmus minor]
MDSNEGSSLSRPSLSFPLGIALLVLMLISISAFFFCCLYWEKLRSFFFSTPQDLSVSQTDIEKPTLPQPMRKRKQPESVPVLMPGDQVPKFIALACPCEPPVLEKITVLGKKPSYSSGITNTQ